VLEKRFDGRIRYAHCDVTSEKDIAAAVKLAADQFGGLDILFNNAGHGARRAMSRKSMSRAGTRPSPCWCAVRPWA